MSLDRIIERRVKKKRKGKKSRRDGGEEIELWNQSPHRMPVIQRFKFTSEAVSP